MFAEAISSLLGSAPSPRRMFASLENPQFNLNSPEAFDVLAGGSRSESGVIVNHEKALTIAGVFQAVSLISGDFSKLPLYPYLRLSDDDREIDTSHKGYMPVAIRANPYKSAKQFWRDIAVHFLLWTNGYAYIDRSGQDWELYNLLPDRTAPEWVKYTDARGQLRSVFMYVTEVNGKLEMIAPSDVLHIRGISLDGCEGFDMAKAARDDWGLALSARNFESKFFKNGARVGGILEIPAAMTKQAMGNIEEGFRKSYEGGENPFKTVILREGARFHAGQVTPEQGQVVELGDQQKRAIASFFNLPPSKLGIRDSVSYNSFEQDNLAYLHGCLHHWLDAAADQCDMKLLSDKELRSDSHYFEHNTSKFVQADWQTLVSTLCELRDSEIVSPNEVRKKLNMPKRTDPGGDKYENPHTRPAEAAKPTKETKPDKKAHVALFVETLNRMARRVGHDARSAAKSPAKFLAWLDGKAVDHRAVFTEAVTPVADAYCSVFGGEPSTVEGSLAAEFFGCLLAALAPLVEPGHAEEDLQANVEREINQFERTAGRRVASLVLEIQA